MSSTREEVEDGELYRAMGKTSVSTVQEVTRSNGLLCNGYGGRDLRTLEKKHQESLADYILRIMVMLDERMMRE